MKSATPFLAGIASTLAIVAAVYTFLLNGGYLIDVAKASAIAQTLVTEAQTTIAQAMDRESIARERGMLQLQLELKQNRLSYLAGKRRTVDEDNEIGFLRSDIAAIRARLAELDRMKL